MNTYHKIALLLQKYDSCAVTGKVLAKEGFRNPTKEEHEIGVWGYPEDIELTEVLNSMILCAICGDIVSYARSSSRYINEYDEYLTDTVEMEGIYENFDMWFVLKYKGCEWHSMKYNVKTPYWPNFDGAY